MADAEQDQGGERKLLAVARHIANTLAAADGGAVADDVLKVYSHFDTRLSPAAAAPPPPPPISSSSSSSFLAAVDELQTTLTHFSHSFADSSLDRAHHLLHHALFRLEDDFRRLLISSDDGADEASTAAAADDEHLPVASRVSDYNLLIDAFSSSTVVDLHEIAKRMVAMEFGIDCSRVYSGCRRDFLEESMSRLGFQSVTPEEILSMRWSEMECRIDRWIKAANVLLRVLLPSERRLCDRVFSGMSKIADLAFLDASRGCTNQLLRFADCFISVVRSPERLFKTLDLFETVRDLMQEFEFLFGDPYSVFLRDEAFAVLIRTGEAIRGIFLELEILISRDPAKVAVPGGDLHPITRYVMNYLRAACRSPQTLAQIFDENGGGIQPRLESRPCSSLALQIIWIMDILESNLEVKSKIYDDASMCCIFMINNKMYMIQKGRDGELGGLLGNDWVRKHMAKIWKLLSDYHKLSWSRALSWLVSVEDGSSLKSLVEKLELFNCHFADKCRVQSTWVICDDQLREEARTWLEENLIPPYQSLVLRIQRLNEFGNSEEKKIKFYSVKEIESGINNLFRGGVGC